MHWLWWASVAVAALAALACLSAFAWHRSNVAAVSSAVRQMRVDPRAIDVPVYFINMDRHVERRAFMEKQLVGVEAVTRVAGVDGRALPASQLGKAAFRNMTPAEVGCALSHINACAQIVEDGHPFALVLEDDASLAASERWPLAVSQLASQAPADWTCIKLFSDPAQGGGGGSDVSVVREHHAFGTVAYLITREWAKTLATLDLDTRDAAIDRFHIPKYWSDVTLTQLSGSRPYRTSVPFVFPNNQELPSTIHDVDTLMHVHSARVITSHWLKEPRRVGLTSMGKRGRD